MIEVDPRAEWTAVERHDLKRLLHRSGIEAGTQRSVDHGAERPAGSAGLGRQFGGHVIVERQRRSRGHIMKCHNQAS